MSLPSRWVAATVFGPVAGLSSYALVDSVLLAAMVGGLYMVGTGLLVEQLRTLYSRTGISDRGSWWALGFVAAVGIVLLVVQWSYRDLPKTGDSLGAEPIVPTPTEYALVLWLLIFGVSLVAFNCGIGMALADARRIVDER